MTEYKIFKWSKRLTFSIYHTGEYHTHTHTVFSRADWPVRKRLAITIYPQADEKTTPCVKNLISDQFFGMLS